MKKYITIIICLMLLEQLALAQRYELAQAKKWYSRQGWLVGANYCPAYAINQLEFWQEATFDLKAIDHELALAQAIGMNSMRVYLHHLAWQVDPNGFKNRMSQFLAAASKHKIKIIFVFFDDCWNDTYKIGEQPSPKPGIHNSGWLKDPGNIVQKGGPLLDTLKAYLTDILTTFRTDRRVLMWDIYNEPGQFDQHDKSRPLMIEAFGWARKADPSQPLTSGIYDDGEREITKFQIENSDVITYHSYDKPEIHQRRIDSLNRVSGGRPLICTEYMARKRGSTFEAILPMLKKQNIGAINWGLVDGKTQTKYAWDEKDWGEKEPALWFHDIFRKDGTPYDPKETELIRSLTKKKK
ncbi:1,4-beta-xylanase [Sphingobacteriaceae bacterium GW460-11-11-14-LB5]|nr:1,4-beta-xylanase [Sphingobacteriaceae bacterium GW460-11-11-14-LB5]